MPEIIHQSLQLPGYWRLATFGKLARIPRRGTPVHVRAYVIQLGDHPPFDFERVDRRWQSAYVPIGEIARLHHNAVIRDGKILRKAPVPFVNAQIQKLNLDFNRSNQRVFGRHEKDDKDELIIPDRTNRLQNDPEGTALFVAIGREGDPYSVIIPCSEVLRFFYATSSMMVNALFAGDFLDPWSYLWNTKDSVITDDGSAFLQLRQYTFDADARFLARFAFDELAVERAQDIYLYASGHRPDEYGERVIRAIPPFEGPTQLAVTAVPITSGGYDRLLVSQIRTCNWAPPFTSLSFDRDNDGRFKADDREGKEPANARKNGRAPIQPDEPPEELSLSTEPASNKTGRWAIPEREITDRFPALSKIPVKKLPQDNTKTAGTKKRQVMKVLGGKAGSVERARSSSELIGQVLIQGLEEVEHPEPEGTLDTDPEYGDAAYRTTLALLRILQEAAKAKISILCPVDQYALVDGAKMSVFPPEIFGSARAWLYIDKEKTKRRLALIASIQSGTETRYLIDIQHKVKHKYAMLVCWDLEGKEISLPILNKTLLACASARGPSLRDLDVQGICWNRIKHFSASATEEDASLLLKRIYKAKAQNSTTGNGATQ